MSGDREPRFDQVLAAARQGSPGALGWLYRRFQPGLLRGLRVIAPHRAEDMAADVWLEVAGGLPGFAGDERAFRGWLGTTARHQAIAAHRRPDRGPARSGPLAGAHRSAPTMARVMSALSPEEADVVGLRVVGGLDVDEVARVLRKAPGTVRSLQQRALRRLSHLDPEGLSA